MKFKSSQMKLVVVGIFIFILVGFVLGFSDRNELRTLPDVYTNQSVIYVELPEGLDSSSGYSLSVLGGADGEVVDGVLEIYGIEGNVTVSLKLKDANFTADFSIFFVEDGEQQEEITEGGVVEELEDLILVEEGENASEEIVEENAMEQEITIEEQEVETQEETNESLEPEITLEESIITGKIIEEQEEENETDIIEQEQNKTETDIPIEINKTIVSEIIINETEGLVEINETIVSETEANVTETNITITTANVTIETIQYKAVVGQAVKWKKTITKPEDETITIELPEETINLTVKKINKQNKQEVIKQVQIKDKDGWVVGFGFVLKTSIYNWFRNLFSFILPSVSAQEESVGVTETSSEIEVEISEQAEEIEIEYWTEAPVAVEEVISSNRKKITISGPDELHYEDILAFTQLPEQLTQEDKYKIKLYNINNNLREIVEIVNYEDSNEDGLIDTIYWVVPHLSVQEYELIIEITKAEHLDENREFISDIYEKVKAQDGVWSEVINSGEYVRVKFEQALDMTKDITIYARIAFVIINGKEVPYDIYQKKKRIDEIRRLLNE